MSKESYYTFEIYKNGELEVVLRSDDIVILEKGCIIYDIVNPGSIMKLKPEENKK